MGAALGVALLGSLRTLLYRADLPEQIAGLGGGAVRDSVARAAAVFGGTGPWRSRRPARVVHVAMQVTAVAAAALLLVAAEKGLARHPVNEDTRAAHR